MEGPQAPNSSYNESNYTYDYILDCNRRNTGTQSRKQLHESTRASRSAAQLLISHGLMKTDALAKFSFRYRLERESENSSQSFLFGSIPPQSSEDEKRKNNRNKNKDN